MAAGARSSRSSHSWSLLPTRKLDCQVSESIIFMRFSPSNTGYHVPARRQTRSEWTFGGRLTSFSRTDNAKM